MAIKKDDIKIIPVAKVADTDIKNTIDNIPDIIPDNKPDIIPDIPPVAKVIEQDVKKVQEIIEDKTKQANYQNNKASKDLENGNLDNEEEEGKSGAFKSVLVVLSILIGGYSLFKFFGSKGSNSTPHANNKNTAERGTEQREQKEGLSFGI